MIDDLARPVVPIVDSHHHLWTRSQHPQDWIDPASMAAIDADFGLDDLAAAVRGVGVGSTVLVQSTASTEETEDLLALAAGSDLVAGVVGWVDLTGDVPAELDRLRQLPGGSRLVGIRHPVQAEPDPGFLDRDDVRRGVAAIGAAGLAFDLLVRAHQLPVALRLVHDQPATSFVLDHLGQPPLHSGDLAEWRQDLADLAAEPNVTAKISGLATQAGPGWAVDDLRPAVDHALDVLGPDRLMFGSDWPVCLLATTYAAWAGAVAKLLPAPGSPDIWGANAVRTYRLQTHLEKESP